MKILNKIVCLSLASLSSLVQCLSVSPVAYPRVEHLKGASLGYALALIANIILGLRSLPGRTPVIMNICKLRQVKIFIALTFGPNVIRTFLYPYITNVHNELLCSALASLSSLV
jgi:hypothetical protein